MSCEIVFNSKFLYGKKISEFRKKRQFLTMKWYFAFSIGNDHMIRAFLRPVDFFFDDALPFHCHSLNFKPFMLAGSPHISFKHRNFRTHPTCSNFPSNKVEKLHIFIEKKIKQMQQTIKTNIRSI